MPNYIYRCIECNHKYICQLPISFDPKIKLACRYSHNGTEFTMTRRIGTPSFPSNCNKVFAGDWFKKTYGFEIGEKETTKAEFQKDARLAEQKYKRDMGC